MSEFQIVMFRAIDRPLTDKQMQFMEQQSSRAEYTKWTYEVQYGYSSFRGDVDGMLRNGYDIYFTYSNCDCHEVRIRLPHGLPFPNALWSKYLSLEGLKWNPDKQGKAGILSITRCPEEANEFVEDYDSYCDATAAIRNLLIEGDLRALYLLWLCGIGDPNLEEDDLLEPPVPHGMATIPEDAKDLLTLFGTGPILVDAAANGIPSLDTQRSKVDPAKSWLASLTDLQRTEILQRLFVEDSVTLKSELLSESRNSQQVSTWPVENPSRTIAQLLKKWEELCKLQEQKEKHHAETKAKQEANKAEKQRQARMVEMRSAPDLWLKKVTELVEVRGTENYRAAAIMLADLREAVGGLAGTVMARKHATHLAKNYPTLNVLKAALRKQRLLD